MNKLLFTMSACCAFALTLQAQAAVRTYDFTATIDGLSLHGDPWGQPVAWLTESEGPNGGPAVKAGQHIVGRFSFDDAMLAYKTTQYGSSHRVGEYNGFASAYRVVENGTAFSGPARASIGDQVSDPDSEWDYDELVIDNHGQHWQLRLQDGSHSLFANGLPTAVLSLDTLSGAGMNAAWRRSDGELISFNVSLTSLTLAPVPEPATWSLMLAGLGVLGFAARRKPG